MKMSVFETKKEEKGLAALVNGMTVPEDCGFGLRVAKINADTYGLIEIWDCREVNRGKLRIIKNMIVSAKASTYIERMLRLQKVGFNLYDEVEIKNPDEKGLKIALTKEPHLIYNPNPKAVKA